MVSAWSRKVPACCSTTSSTIFTAAPGASNAYGLVGFEANLPGPGKRPLSSMSPTIVLKDGKPVLVTGSPGGSRHHLGGVAGDCRRARLWHGCRGRGGGAARATINGCRMRCGSNSVSPDDTLACAAGQGHRVVEPLSLTSANSIAVTEKGLLGAPDPRTRGAEAAGQ